MSSGGKQALVLGVDLGTTATKVVAGTRGGEIPHQAERGYEMRTDDSGEAVQDAAEVRDAAIEALGECARWAADNGHSVEAVSFSSAMHTLVGLDSAGSPVTPVFTWADSRAAEVAEQLRAEPESASALHRATGTPVHTQSVMVKLAWLTGERTDLAGEAVRWCSLKDYVVAALVGEFVTDHSMASGTGLQEMDGLRWHDPALEVAGVRADQLPELAAPTDTRPLSADVAAQVGLPEGLPVVLGGGDGPLANLGVGAVSPGVAALSLGTSGALRVLRDRPGVDERCRTFCYALADDLWVVGGAVSNGGVVGQWAAEAFGVEVAELLDEARQVPAGAEGLVVLPYLLGERAPWWQPGLTGSMVGLRRSHGRAEITRAAVEGVAQQLALVRDAVLETGAEVNAVRATGGGLRSSLWPEALAASLGVELELAESSGGSGLGAVLLGWRALGELGSLEDVSGMLRPESAVAPDADAAELMERRRPVVQRLHEALSEIDV